MYLAVTCGVSILALTALCAWMMVDRRNERQEVRAERADLLLRISETQQQTVTRHFNEREEVFSPPARNPDIDEDYMVSKDDLADLAAREEMTSGR